MSLHSEQEFDMTPMVDVTFLILVFFMVTASFSTHRAIETPKPDHENSSPRFVETERQTDLIRLHVDQFGSFLLMASDWQREIVGKKSLVTELVAAKSAAPTEIHLVIEVESAARLQALVDAMDAATIAGFDQFQWTEIDSELI